MPCRQLHRDISHASPAQAGGLPDKCETFSSVFCKSGSGQLLAEYWPLAADGLHKQKDPLAQTRTLEAQRAE